MSMVVANQPYDDADEKARREQEKDDREDQKKKHVVTWRDKGCEDTDTTAAKKEEAPIQGDAYASISHRVSSFSSCRLRTQGGKTVIYRSMIH